MRLQRLLMLSVVLCFVLAAIACAGGASDSPAEEAVDSAAEAAEAAESLAEETAEVMDAAFEVGQEVTLQGQLGCGHCNFQKGESCSAAMQVAAGPVVILDVSEDHELFTDRFSQKQIEVVGTVAAIDAAGAHVEVVSFTTVDS